MNVYNFISVDNDGANEFFNIEGILKYPSNNVQIYNRWGQLVYVVNGYNNSERSFSGISNANFNYNTNNFLPEGTYYYIIKYYKPISGNQIEKTGYLYLTY